MPEPVDNERVVLDEDDVPWDSDNSLPWWTDGTDDAAIGGYAPCESF